MNYQDAIKHALNGEAILFAGAGFSSGVINQNYTEFKRATELCELLCEKLEIDFYNDLAYISQRFIDKFGSESLIELLQKEFISLDAQVFHKDIAKIDWKRIYTTNYDDVIEKASDQVGKARVPVTLSNNPVHSLDKSNLIIHLNGYIKSLTSEKLYSEFKLSRESYINDSFTESGWATLFKHDVDNAKVIFFVGYSLQYDLDIQRLIGTSDAVREKCYFVTRENLKGIELDRMKEIGNVLPIGTSGFAKEINEVSSSYIPLEFVDSSFYFFEHLNKQPKNISELRDKDISNLLIKGEVSFSHIFNYGAEKSYLVQRDYEKPILDMLENGKKAIIIHSNLGNGKTVFLNSLQSELIKQGSEVFILKNSDDECIKEIEKLVKMKGKIFVFIENYNLHIKNLKFFKLFDSPNLKFVLTARSYIHDNFYLQLIENMGLNDETVMIYEINKLSNQEIKSLVAILNEFHLWGEFSSLTEKEKIYLLKNTYQGTFQSILLGILNSKIMASKINEIINIIESDDVIREIVYTSFINNIIGLGLRLDEMLFLLESNSFSARIIRNHDVNELINIKENIVVVKSSVFAQYILKNTQRPDKLVDLLIKLVSSADAKILKNQFKHLMKLLVSFSNIRMILNERDPNFSDNVIRYFENIKNLKFNQKNPFFWFQYAIARLDLKHHAEAKIYFDNAFSYAKEMNMIDTFQLNTHYARYLLENEIYNGTDSNLAFQNFFIAHNLIYENGNQNKHLHYPLRHGKYYLDFYQKFYLSLPEASKAKFLLCCYQILEKINFYKSYMSQSSRSIHPDVRKSEESVSKVVRLIKGDF